jgi:hypothetical protein
LFMACRSGNIDAVQALLQHGATISSKNNVNYVISAFLKDLNNTSERTNSFA